MQIQWSSEAWEDYLYWQTQDKKTIKKINDLIKDISRNGHSGLAKSEPLVGDLSGWWSKRIDSKNRLIYSISEGQESVLRVLACRSHYGE